MRIPNEMRDCTCYICVQIGDTFRVGATGFFMVFPSREEPALNWRYLITAKHCIFDKQNRRRKLFARINTKEGFSFVELPDHWVFHDDPASDIAILPFEKDPSYELGAIDFRSGASKEVIEANHIGIGNEILIIGLFASRAGTHRNIPIVRSGMISAMPEELIHDKHKGTDYHAYLIETYSIAGLSGSPVFVHVPAVQLRREMKSCYANGYLFLLGLIRGHFDEPPFPEPLDREPRSVHYGISTVTPIWEVLETVEQNDDLYQRRRADVRALRKRNSETLDSSFEKHTGDSWFTKGDFEKALKKASRRVPSSKSGKEKK